MSKLCMGVFHSILGNQTSQEVKIDQGPGQSQGWNMHEGVTGNQGGVGSMKLNRVALVLGLGLLFTGCSTIGPISRDQIAENLAPILEVENRVSRAMSGVQMLGSVGEISDKDAEKLKSHYDIYSVYYHAANVYLAVGDIESYISHRNGQKGIGRDRCDTEERSSRGQAVLKFHGLSLV